MTPMIRLVIYLSCLLAPGLCAVDSRGTPWTCHIIGDS